jgi:cellulose synthase/poly-beta-1,6-N-acetylglucosamine synthase-like glycosyltransferase
MLGFGIAVFVILVSSAVIQGIVTVGFLRVLWRFRRTRADADYCPKAAVILCLRGCDPFLQKCLESILTQDYPDYEVHIVVDRVEDPAWKVAESLVERYGAKRAHIETLGTRHGTCSLKCSSVTQAIDGLDDSIEVVALVDADTLAHPTWLRELAAPLKDERVAVTTGNRWYMPESSTWGAMVRYLWNAAAVVQMFWDGVCWGGTLAIKRSVLVDGEILDRWRHAICEDTMLFQRLRERKMRVEFVPSLMMVNREECQLGACFSWIRRQLLNMRLYHPLWPLVLLHGVGTTLVLIVTVAAMAIAAIGGNWAAALWCAAGLAVYESIMVSLLWPLEFAVRRIAQAQGGATRWLSARTIFRLVPAIVLTQFVYTFALFGAHFARKVSWRGIHYRIAGPWEIERLDDSTYDGDPACVAQGHSL